MVKLSTSQLKEVLGWASRQRDAKGRSLLERARQSLLSGSYLKYNTSLSKAEDGAVVWDCDCPYVQKTGKPCKHVIAHIILAHMEELRESSKAWEEWVNEYWSKQVEEAINAFAQF